MLINCFSYIWGSSTVKNKHYITLLMLVKVDELITEYCSAHLLAMPHKNIKNTVFCYSDGCIDF